MRLLLTSFLLCTALGAPADFDGKWIQALVTGTGQDGELLRILQTRFALAGPALSEAVRHGSRVIPLLAGRGAVTWPESPAGPGLEEYLAVAAAQDAEDAARQLGSISENVERASRLARRAAGEDAADLAACFTDLDALTLLARFHARKILAAHSLIRFHASGDVASLRRAAWNMAAALVLWDRLCRTAGRGLLFGPDAQNNRRNALHVARADISYIGQVEGAFQRYGLFDAALAFGPKQDADAGPFEQPGVRWPQGRFRLLHPGLAYSRARGFGWRVAESVRPAGGEALRGSGSALLAVDVPDGEYRVTSLVLNQPELASGTFHIRAGSDSISYAPGETGEKSMHTRVTGGVLELVLVPESGNDWLLSSLVVARRAPHFGWIPPRAVQAGSAASIAVTITAPDGIRDVSLSCAGPGGEPVRLPLTPDGPQHRTSIRWPQQWKGKQVRCTCSAVDRMGSAARFPASGELQIEVR